MQLLELDLETEKLRDYFDPNTFVELGMSISHGSGYFHWG